MGEGYDCFANQITDSFVRSQGAQDVFEVVQLYSGPLSEEMIELRELEGRGPDQGLFFE